MEHFEIIQVNFFLNFREEFRMLLHRNRKPQNCFAVKQKDPFQKKMRTQMKYAAPVSLMAIALFAFAFLGCSSDAPKSNKDKSAAAGGSHEHGGDGHDHGDGDDHDHGKEKKDVKLSADDLAAVKAQKICPVSEEELDSMGTPIKVDVKGGPIWVCCKGCIKKVKADPEKYLAVLKKQK